MDLCDKSREPRHEKFTSLDTRTNYQKANREVRKKMKEAKEEWIEEQCVNIDTEIKTRTEVAERRPVSSRPVL
ncbi:hypothetical protein DPMN_158490 [Dreissena polymorpha]|uniref:Uncharacterized protein n=1 Tax=Dreissena polymorpha TaxID=45954 RepID=A0A9D4ELG7_DREPO|nr:hypothetical protein DPMN_158490 [Dreissena polymorpha]